MKAVLLAGGLGTRLREETEFRPKPMVEVGGRPILWHIMKGLAQQGITEFVVATGYKSDVIKDYFLNYAVRNHDFTVRLGRASSLELHNEHDEAAWTVTVAYTGESTMTGGRVLRAARYLNDEPFLVAYGDGLADIDVSALVASHESAGRLATVSTVQPTSRFGIMDLDEDGLVREFREKPKVDGWINIGFFVMEPAVLGYLDEDCVLEQEPLARLAAERQLHAFRHEGFWQPMDTYRDSKALNDLWDSGHAPWRSW
ncbi:MAG: glucose-1-phosphate cytidylyltransferase [Actinomycetota bacterium]|nr:glucose-1-phosphate cytidylyltransferase [Actinomycetota bacterium]